MYSFQVDMDMNMNMWCYSGVSLMIEQLKTLIKLKKVSIKNFGIAYYILWCMYANLEKDILS